MSVLKASHLERYVREQRAAGKRIVFTNGVFDLLHLGHVDYLEKSRALGDRLVIGLNSDASVRRLKGPMRPVVGEHERRRLLESLGFVDLVVVFDDPTPERLIRELRPDVLAKGADWAPDQIVGREFVESYGGRVVSVPLRAGFSTTALVERVRSGGG